MLFAWPARIAGHIGAIALVQVPGGMLAFADPHQMLVDDTETEVQASDPTHAIAGAVFGATFTAEQAGSVALLTVQSRHSPAAPAGAVVPLLVDESQRLPTTFTLSIPVRPVAVADEDADPKPFGGPPPNCCPDIDPGTVHAMLPCCCPDIDPTHIDALVCPQTGLDFLADLLSIPVPEPIP